MFSTRRTIDDPKKAQARLRFCLELAVFVVHYSRQ
jgi:hypothetical protein